MILAMNSMAMVLGRILAKEEIVVYSMVIVPIRLMHESLI